MRRVLAFVVLAACTQDVTPPKELPETSSFETTAVEPTETVVVVPRVEGQSLDRAKTLIRGRGLRIEAPIQQQFSQAPAGRVIEQFPGAGTEAEPEDEVSLVVSKGPSPQPPPPEPEPPACDSNYSPCVPPYPPDLDCPDIGFAVQVIGSDPHGFDADGDGFGCESYG